LNLLWCNEIARHREEEAAFNAEVESVAKWMAIPRFRYSKRPYTALDVVRLRSPLHRMSTHYHAVVIVVVTISDERMLNAC
jgi:hypothetical protein